MNKPGQFCWSELATTDLYQAKQFYHKVFGWEFREVKMDNAIHTIASVKEMDIAGMLQIPGEMKGQIQPHWMSYILVENIEDSLELALKNGAYLVKEIEEINDRGKYALITDPTGAYLAIWETTGDNV